MAITGTLIGPTGWTQAHAAPWPASVELLRPASSRWDMRFANARGTIALNNRVFVKTSAAAPELPMAGARVRLHRLTDGYCAWQGISDAQGYYHASGLEVGLKYIPVAIDPTGTYECVAAGPVIAEAALA